jgi:tetratricopeptide (TPR) repeat protein
MALARAGRKDEAAARMEAAARVFPDAHFLVAHFALVLRESGYPQLAELAFRQAARLDPHRTDVGIALGNLAFDRKDYAAALEEYGAVLERKPDSIEALANLGKVHTLRKDYAAAEPLLKRALELRPDYATALSTLGGIRIEEGRFEEAQDLLERARDLPSSKETLLTVYGNLGILHFKRRDRARAIECFEKVLEIDPADAQARAALERLRR